MIIVVVVDRKRMCIVQIIFIPKIEDFQMFQKYSPVSLKSLSYQTKGKMSLSEHLSVISHCGTHSGK